MEWFGALAADVAPSDEPAACVCGPVLARLGLATSPAEFRARWGREMTAADPLVPDWDADVLAPMPAEKLAMAVALLRSVLAPVAGA